MIKPLIKWSGSKRSQADEIIKYFPRIIDTYYEPFVGGGSLFYQLLSQRHVNHVVCSDINPDLVSLWNLIKTSPEALFDHYKRLWNELYYINDIEAKKQFYYNVRERFNKHKNPKDFFFLTRTSVNGLVRYNSKKEFNTSFHFSRDGIKPENIKEILFDWYKKIQNVEFVCRDYKEVCPSKSDFVYIDPPYIGTNAMYYGTIDYEELWEWMRTLKCPYLLSFNGLSNENDRTYAVPDDIYDSHIYIESGRSSFKQLQKPDVVEYVQESLYTKGCKPLKKEVREIENVGTL